MKVINLKLFFLLFFLLSQPISSKNIEFIEKIYEYKNTKNIDIYFGQLKNKKKSGIGRLITNHGEDNQEVYYGEFKNDQKHGHGIIYYSSKNDKQTTCGLFKKNKMKSIVIKFNNGNGYFGDLNTKRLDDLNFGIFILNNGGYEIGNFSNELLLHGLAMVYDRNNELLLYGAFNTGEKLPNNKFFDDMGDYRSLTNRSKKNADSSKVDCEMAKQIEEKIKDIIPLNKKFYSN